MFGLKLGGRPQPLKPFLLKTRDGFLLGLAMDPGKGSPCAQCAEFWLKDRNVYVEKADLSELRIRRELIAELLSENSAHVFYEIAKDGTEMRLDTIVYPHPKCICEKTNYIPPREITKKTNFAFSPIYQLKCARFGTPDGNLWLASAIGESPVTKKLITAYGVEHDKDAARFRAVDHWMKLAVEADLAQRMEQGELLPSENLQTGNVELITKSMTRKNVLEGIGVGKNREEAIMDALIGLAKVRTLKKYSAAVKSPMLIVGANNWVRTRVPFFLLQQYDLHLLFYPNSTQAWVVGLAAFSRLRVDEKPVFVFAADSEIGKALDQLFCKLLAALRPGESDSEMPRMDDRGPTSSQNSKLNLWWTHWIYRCPKISLKDVLHLDPYPRSLDNWRNYFKDGQEQVSILSINNEYFPSQLRTIVKLQVNTAEQLSNVRNINGIGTWADFSDALA